jgi:hypothetical protein
MIPNHHYPIPRRRLAGTARFALVALLCAASAGCAAYRDNLSAEVKELNGDKVMISRDAMRDRARARSESIRVEVTKLTIYHSDPTEEMANELLRKKAAALDADAVVNVSYRRGLGYIEARGDAVKFSK